MKKIGIIIPAAGTGSRMGGGNTNAGAENNAKNGATGGVPKQFMLLAGKPVLAWSIAAFRCVARYAEIVVALPADQIETWERLQKEHRVPAHTVCTGGATRFQSVKNALDRLSPRCEYIAVHDAARPLVSGELILRTVEVARSHGSAIPAVPITDSIRRVTDSGSHPENRNAFRGIQTPQVFRADILRTACGRAVGDDWSDEATAVESVGYTVVLCEGERRNIKITEKDDMAIAESLLKGEPE